MADALRNGLWWISSSRSRNLIITLLLQCLPNPMEIAQAEVDDRYSWKTGMTTPTDKFPASETWNSMQPTKLEVDWHKTV